MSLIILSLMLLLVVLWRVLRAVRRLLALLPDSGAHFGLAPADTGGRP